MDILTIFGFTAFVSVLMYLTSVRNSLSVDYKQLSKRGLTLIVLFDIFINVGHAVAGGVFALLVFELRAMRQYQDYVVLGVILTGLFFKDTLPVMKTFLLKWLKKNLDVKVDKTNGTRIE